MLCRRTDCPMVLPILRKRRTDVLFTFLFSHVCFKYKICVPLAGIPFIGAGQPFAHTPGFLPISRITTWNRVTLDDLAKVIHITPQYLSRLFREFTGESVLSYLTSVRLNFAYLKLFDAGLSLEDIAQSTGFPSVRSFSSAFKQSYGQTPGEYRKSLSLATEGKDTPASSQNDELLKAEKQLFSFGQSENAPAAFPVLNERHEIYEIVLSSVDRCCPPFRKKGVF